MAAGHRASIPHGQRTPESKSRDKTNRIIRHHPLASRVGLHRRLIHPWLTIHSCRLAVGVDRASRQPAIGVIHGPRAIIDRRAMALVGGRSVVLIVATGRRIASKACWRDLDGGAIG